MKKYVISNITSYKVYPNFIAIVSRLSIMKVLLILFVYLSLHLEATEGHGLNALTFMILKNFNNRVQEKTPMEIPEKTEEIEDPDELNTDLFQTRGGDISSCSDIPAWSIYWFIYGCRDFEIRRGRLNRKIWSL